MTDAATRCAHCEAPIVDTITQVLHGSQVFCCTNCSSAMEQTTGGSDPQGARQENEIRCERCTTAIVDDSTMVQQGDRIFCCRNCASAAAS